MTQSAIKPGQSIGTITVVEDHALDIEIVLPLRLVSEANAHAHWRVRQRRAKQQRGTVLMALGPAFAPIRNGFMPTHVTITRLSPRQLDSDNLVGACKHVRDGVADALGVNDRDPRVYWVCAQRKPTESEQKGLAGGYGVKIRVYIPWPGKGIR